MSSSSGIGQLLKGMIMGVVLILAIIGTMSMLDKNKEGNSSSNSSQITDTNITATNTNKRPEIKPPEINISSQTPNNTTNQTPNPSQTVSDNFKPTLESENKDIEKQEKPVKYGILKVNTINPNNKQNLMTNYVVFDQNNIKVAESNNSSGASFRLPVGNYQVISTLVRKDNTGKRQTTPTQNTKTITIAAHKLTDKVFELEPPPTIGVLQVSAINAKNKQAMKANFFIQKENGEAIASRQNVTQSLFKLKAGIYKVTVKSGNNSDFRTIVVEPGESVIEVFNLQETFLQGKVLVQILDNNTKQPVSADIEIITSSGKVAHALRAVSQTEIALAAGNYQIKVTGFKGVSTKNITVIAGKSSNHTFQIDNPVSPNTTDPVQITDNVKTSGVDKNTSTNSTNESSKSILKLFARNEVNQKPIKSNFYVQTPNGKHIAKKIYADSAEFNLKPGKYKITVRAKNRKNIIRNIQISANQAITEVFSLQSNIPTTGTNNQPFKPSSSITSKPTITIIPNGFLNVMMLPARKTHFIIANRKGKKIVELTSVPSGNFKLDTGIYTVTAILNGKQRKKTIQVYKGKTSRINFNANNFQNSENNKNIKKGSLRSRIVDNQGRPLRGNLTVKNLRGQVVARANNVTFGVFDLPAVPHIISVNYRGLLGSEKVNITAGKTTVQTFTISPNNSIPKTPSGQKQRDVEDILKEKLKEEFRRIF